MILRLWAVQLLLANNPLKVLLLDKCVCESTCVYVWACLYECVCISMSVCAWKMWVGVCAWQVSVCTYGVFVWVCVEGVCVCMWCACGERLWDALWCLSFPSPPGPRLSLLCTPSVARAAKCHTTLLWKVCLLIRGRKHCVSLTLGCPPSASSSFCRSL